jgi:hypothetical protein
VALVELIAVVAAFVISVCSVELSIDFSTADQDGAAAPFDFSTVPDVPEANKAVESFAVWYGRDPVAPPAMFVALVAVVAVNALPVVLWLRVGKSEAMAIDGAPVAVVFLTMPVAREDIWTLLIFVTVSTPLASVTSPVWVAFETLAVLAVISADNAELRSVFAILTQVGAAAPLDLRKVPEVPASNTVVSAAD